MAAGYRARVEVDLHKPLSQGTMTETLYMGPTWVGFEYSGVPFHSCKKCFRFTHDTAMCNEAPPTVTELLRITTIGTEFQQQVTYPGREIIPQVLKEITSNMISNKTRHHQSSFEETVDLSCVDCVTTIEKVAVALRKEKMVQITEIAEPVEKLDIKKPGLEGMEICCDPYSSPKPIKVFKPKAIKRKPNPYQNPTQTTPLLSSLPTKLTQKLSKSPTSQFHPKPPRPPKPASISSKLTETILNRKRRLLESKDSRPLKKRQSKPNATIPMGEGENFTTTPTTNPSNSVPSNEAIIDMIHSPNVTQLLLAQGLVIKSLWNEHGWDHNNQLSDETTHHLVDNNNDDHNHHAEWEKDMAIQMSIEAQISFDTSLEGVDLSILDSTTNSITSELNRGTRHRWLACFFYGSPYNHLRSQSWDPVRKLSNYNCPILVISDLNVILSPAEVLGGKPYEYNDGEPVHDIINTHLI
ncbi:hypothetical protein IFM89_017863 [Coptis chinensis]|uniref:Uncharacterized protein n=1 Tax=Coptis chinensis TaxID=261450 RepID=A0A835MA71_9MAGN|nr:hypothetical protein IFM89_017863 [Coptis chinensis]